MQLDYDAIMRAQSHPRCSIRISHPEDYDKWGYLPFGFETAAEKAQIRELTEFNHANGAPEWMPKFYAPTSTKATEDEAQAVKKEPKKEDDEGMKAEEEDAGEEEDEGGEDEQEELVEEP